MSEARSVDEIPDGVPASMRPSAWPINRYILLGWAVLYVVLMGSAGWPFEGRSGILDFGSPGNVTLERYGAAVPWRIQAGEWQRLFLSPWLHSSLLGLLLLLWFWGSLGRSLTEIMGARRTWIVFVLGGVAGAAAQTLAYPDSRLIGAGPFDPVMAALGTSAAWAYTNRDPRAALMRRSVVVTLVILGVLHWFFTKDAPPSLAAAFGREAMLAAFGAGIVLLCVFGPRRCMGPTGQGTRITAWLLFGALLVAIGFQVPKVLAGERRSDVKAFLADLHDAERTAWRILDGHTNAPERDRGRLSEALHALRAHPFLDDWEGAPALKTYLDQLVPIAEGNTPDPDGTRIRCRRSFDAYYEEHEGPLRAEVGLEPRGRAQRFWEPL